MIQSAPYKPEIFLIIFKVLTRSLLVATCEEKMVLFTCRYVDDYFINITLNYLLERDGWNEIMKVF